MSGELLLIIILFYNFALGKAKFVAEIGKKYLKTHFVY